MERRLSDYLHHMRQAAHDACAFVEGMTRDQFFADKRTQQAVVMCLIIIGEAAMKVAAGHPDFVASRPDVPWRSMRGMRNRIAHGYFDIDLELVWDTAQRDLPYLLNRLPKFP